MSHSLHDFYRGKRVLVTGHTGFQGGWTVAWLKLLGAQVCGYGLPPISRPNFFDATLLDRGMTSIFADVRDRDALANAFAEFQPEIVLHCATRSTPQLAYREPTETFFINVLGTVFIIEEARLTGSVRAIVNIGGIEGGLTSTPRDKGTLDVFNATMACIELVGSAFSHSFLQTTSTAVATARAGEVIGGGDWREGRTVPNLVRSIMCGEPVDLSNGPALRTWHVLEAVCAYLSLARKLFENGHQHSGTWDFGPDSHHEIPAAQLAKNFVRLWDGAEGSAVDSKPEHTDSPAAELKASRKQAQLGWSNLLSKDEAIAWTVEWYRFFYGDASSAWRTTEQQIDRYMQMMERKQRSRNELT